MIKADKIILADARRQLYNSKADQIRPWVLKYWEAIKQLQNKPINYHNDFKTLEAVGLGTAQLSYYQNSGFYWNYEILQLNKQLKIKI